VTITTALLGVFFYLFDKMWPTCLLNLTTLA